ncbi:MAG: helix-turn-helix domain-containing protein [Treponema sp.]|jgi:AraC family transcriptional regulator|nr:helix-turn-helix domain-containing protein [Treponema sp.]
MVKPYDLLENVLIDIEKGISKGINIEILATRYSLSDRHLCRLFQFAFKQPIAGYIRSRKLAASLDVLLKTNSKIVEIALGYDFDYEQSYIKSFKREFGITPGDLRKSGQIVKVKPPLYLYDENRLDGSAFFGPDFVMVPQFHVIGKCCRVPVSDSVKLPADAGRHFWDNDRSLIKQVINPNVYIGITHKKNHTEVYSDYTPSVQVKNLSNIPHGYSGHTFDASLCARFRYIGQHHYYDLNADIAGMMYKAIWKFYEDNQTKYRMSWDKVYFERIDTGKYDGTYCQLEWFTPVTEKV